MPERSPAVSTTRKTILLGTHVYPARADAATRQKSALATWTKLPSVSLINLQFKEGATTQEAEGFETLSLLASDSITVSGKQGPRKPILSEMLATLAQLAAERGITYFGFSNSDILLFKEAIDYVRTCGKDAVIFSRMDVDPTSQQDRDEFISGQDTMFLSVDFFGKIRHRLRPYVVGEMPWDVIYTSILLAHGNAQLINRGSLTRHIQHDVIWVNSPFYDYCWHLAKLDWTYMARWYRYYYSLIPLRKQNAVGEQEEQLLHDVFRHPITLFEKVKNVYRRFRYGMPRAPQRRK